MGDQTTESIIMAALSTLTPTQLSTLSLSLSSTFHHHHRRLALLLSSPTFFTHTLNHLYSLSLPQKSLLISRHLLSFLHLLDSVFPPSLSPTLPSHHSPTLRLHDLDSVLLLLFFCEIRQRYPTSLDDTSPLHWRDVLAAYFSDTMLQISGFAILSSSDVLRTFVEVVVKLRRFVSSKGCNSRREEYVKRREVPASVAAVVALPSVEVGRGSGECVICREELREGRDVCELPCQHMFHWMCVLRWLRKRNTCPCCRFRLPTDDVYGEIDRLWDVIVKLGEWQI